MVGREALVPQVALDVLTGRADRTVQLGQLVGDGGLREVVEHALPEGRKADQRHVPRGRRPVGLRRLRNGLIEVEAGEESMGTLRWCGQVVYARGMDGEDPINLRERVGYELPQALALFDRHGVRQLAPYAVREPDQASNPQ